jgi:hypothetical protein
MAKYLRQNTASQEIPIGRMVDATDGNTAETGLTIANTDIDLWKHGATTLADKNSGGATHIAGGVYYATLDATDTNTAGALKIFVQVAGALAWEDSYTVLPEIVYDSFFPAAGAPIPLFGVVDWGTAQASASGSLVHRSGLSLADDILNGASHFVYSGTGAGQSRIGHDFTGATDTSSVSPNWTTTPSTDSLYVTFRSPPASTSAPVASNVTQFGGTAGTFSGGRPEVNTSHISGSAVSTSSAQIGVNVVQISADSVAADNAEAFFDGTGYAGTNNVIPTVTAVTGFTAANVGAILALLDDPRTEPGQGNPPVNPDLATKIDYLYKAWRNRKTQTSSEYALYADDGTTKDQEAAISSDGTTLVIGEVVTGA